MAETELVSVRVPIETAQRLKALAEAMQRSKSFLGAQAIEEFVAAHEWQLAAIREGVDAADAGQVVEHDRVTAWVESWGTDSEKEKP
jgi:predicted transcriptional regulator